MTAKTLSSGAKTKKKYNKWGSGEIKRHIAFLTMLLPGMTFLACFNYLPMPAIILAFKRYQLAKPPKDFWIQNKFVYSLFVDNEWVGFSNFKFMFNTPDAWMVVRNTVGYNLVFMALGLVLAVGLAIIINELNNRFAAKLYHTILFMPYFISWIVVAYLVYAFVSAKGVFNQVLTAMGQPTINWYSEAKYWPFIFVFCNIWKYTGNNSIIYLATLSGFDQELYEAAAIDGATKWQQIRLITLPLLKPTAITLFLFAVGRIMKGQFELFFQLVRTNGVLFPVTDIIDTYVFRSITTNFDTVMSTAAGFYQSLFGFVLIMTINTVIKKIKPEYALF